MAKCIVGRREYRLHVPGNLEEANQATGFKLETSDNGGYGSSDQFSFLPKEDPRPVLLHRTAPGLPHAGDTWDKIDASSAARLVDFIGSVAERLIDAPKRPRFVRQSR